MPLSVCNRVMEDKLLIWKFRLGSREALRRIYDKYHADILKIAVVLTGGMNTAEDIVQDVFTKFAERTGRFTLSGSLRNYLITSTINGVRNMHRDDIRHKTQNLDEADGLPSGQRQPDQWAVLSEQLERLSCAMAGLPYEQREVITLRMEADMTLRKIAAMQKTSVSTVQARYRYGIEKLRSLLNSEVKA
jgi:RNA polymerase sigma-70 factor (ECF subfamily)